MLRCRPLHQVNFSFILFTHEVTFGISSVLYLIIFFILFNKYSFSSVKSLSLFLPSKCLKNKRRFYFFRHSGVQDFPEFPANPRSLANSGYIRSPSCRTKANPRSLFRQFDSCLCFLEHPYNFVYPDVNKLVESGGFDQPKAKRKFFLRFTQRNNNLRYFWPPFLIIIYFSILFPLSPF